MWSQSLVIVEKNQSDTWKYETTNRAQSACLDDILSSKYQPSFHNEVIDANELSELIGTDKKIDTLQTYFWQIKVCPKMHIQGNSTRLWGQRKVSGIKYHFILEPESRLRSEH